MSNKDNKLEPAERKRGASRTLFKDAIARALLADNSKRLNALIEKAFTFAEHCPPDRLGDFVAIMKFLAERVDGRPAQSVEITDNTLELPSAGSFKIVRVEPAKDE